MTRKRSEACRRGHAWTDANTLAYRTSSGYTFRICRACRALRETAYRSGSAVAPPPASQGRAK